MKNTTTTTTFSCLNQSKNVFFSFFHCILVWKTIFDGSDLYVLGKRVHPWNLESYLFAKAERLPVSRSRSRFNPGMRFPKAKDVSTWLSVRRPSRRLPPSLPSPPWRPSASAPPDSRCADPRAENKSRPRAEIILRIHRTRLTLVLSTPRPLLSDFPFRRLSEWLWSWFIHEIFTLIKAMLLKMLYYVLGLSCWVLRNSPPWKTEYTLNKHILNRCNLSHDSDNLQG